MQLCQGGVWCSWLHYNIKWNIYVSAGFNEANDSPLCVERYWRFLAFNLMYFNLCFLALPHPVLTGILGTVS